MAILQSCCCWRSVRKGSYASALYTTGYFTVMTVLMSRVLNVEHLYLQGNTTLPQTSSVLEPDALSPTTMGLTVVWLCCALCGIVTSLLLMYGLYRDNRVLLVPWILTVIVTLLVDLTHIIYIFCFGKMKFEPLTAMLFTMDFFLLSLNLYSLLCVVSQYQEYKAGRGTAGHDDFVQRVPAVRYAPHPTATSCLSTRRGATYHETQSPTAPHSTVLGDDSATSRSPFTKAPLRKHVQFPDDTHLASGDKSGDVSEEVPSGDVDSGAVVVLLEEPWTVASKAPTLVHPGVDTAPLIRQVK